MDEYGMAYLLNEGDLEREKQAEGGGGEVDCDVARIDMIRWVGERSLAG
jgi:hypothetical protein